MREALERFLATCTSNLLSLIGTGITTAAAFLFVLLLLMHLVGEQEGGPYAGILTFLILPALFLLGLALIPIGIFRAQSRRRAARSRGESYEPPFKVLNFNKRSTRKAALIFLAATGVNALILGIGTYKGVEVMESTAFCGTACHTVMEPEHTTYQRSPHARVKCVECHIGPGADWFVKSKLSGSWQVVSVAFDLYPRPIAAPVHSLRPARETCEECHWPQKFVGDRFKVNTHYEEDEANTEVKTVLVLKVGGQQAGRSHGIHWHVDPDHVVRYRADEKRQTMYEVEMTDNEGKVTLWNGPEAESPEAATAEWPEPRGGPGGDRQGHRRLLRVRAPRDRAEPRRGHRGGGQGGGRYLRLERLSRHERHLGDVREPHRPPRLQHRGRVLPLPRRRARDRGRRDHLDGLHHLPLGARGEGGEPGDPADAPRLIALAPSAAIIDHRSSALTRR